MSAGVPPAVRRAAGLVGAQGAVGIVAAVVFVIRGLAGADRHVVDGFGTAAWFAIFAAALLVAAWALWTGRRWGRGIAIYAQMLLLPVSWYVGVGSHQWIYAVPLALLSLAILALLFSRSTIQWLTSRDIAASADNSGPETR
ncbi:MAG: hypothetical protein WCP30_06885 [Mycobacteriaceae bacterium]